MATIKDVAKLAGVSPSTASRALSGKSYTSEDTRKKVYSAAKELHYSAHPAAQVLRAGKSASNTIALFVPSIQNLIIPSIVQGVENVAIKHGYTTILCNIDESIEREKDYIDKMLAKSIDGFIVASLMSHSDQIHNLHKNGTPIVLVNRIKDNAIDAVLINNKSSSFDAVQYLISTGHKRIAFAMGDTSLLLYNERLEGYRSALESYNISFNEKLVIQETYGEESLYALTRNLMASPHKPDAILASSDPKAIVIMRAIRDIGLRIPEDISVMGIDNVPIGAMLYPALSTVSQPLSEIGAFAVRKLINQIEYKKAHGCLRPPIVDFLETELIIRGSTR